LNNLTPQRIAFIISIVVSSILAGAILFYNYYFFNLVNTLVPVLIFITAFIVCYFIFQFTLEEFIYERIKVIYKTIHSLKANAEKKKELQQIDLKRDIISEVNQEVIDWAQNYETEIQGLKKLETYRREFLGNVSHELKTPIFNIQGYINTLLDGGLEDPSVNKDFLERANRSVERMITIVEDLQSISQLETGELQLEVESLDIVQLIKEVFHAQEFLASQRKISFLFNQEYEPIWVDADKFRIRQILTNLLVNSVKYGKDGGKTTVAFYDMDQNILIEVKDNGIGISQKHLPRLFERFYRVDKSRSRDSGGTGLGLAIVKHIIEAHKQVINVRSAEGMGSTFSFTLKKARPKK
jgi:two-component system, OmpR family, phosphate regulon sensor histidine kinase PhoR